MTHHDQKNISVYAAAGLSDDVRPAAEALAEHLGTVLISDGAEAELQREAGLLLTYDEKGLSLEGGSLTMRADLAGTLPRLKQANLEREMLVKAARIKGTPHPLLLDATAGMGEDSLLLAAAGFEVTMYEYDPVIAALLRDALHRAENMPQLSQIVSHMRLVEGDSIAAMCEIAKMKDKGMAVHAAGAYPDVILLDPMFPERSKSALIKKKFQLLQQLESPCSDEKDLLEAAMSVRPRKIVIKRPAKGAYLAGVKPDYSLSGKAIRYDVIVSCVSGG